MTSTIVDTVRLHLPSTIGDRVRVELPSSARVRNVLYVKGEVLLVVERPAGEKGEAQREFVCTLDGYRFTLPVNNAYVGSIVHPKHGCVHVYDVTS